MYNVNKENCLNNFRMKKIPAEKRFWPRNSKILEPEYVYTIDDTVARWPKILTNNFKSVI